MSPRRAGSATATAASSSGVMRTSNSENPYALAKLWRNVAAQALRGSLPAASRMAAKTARATALIAENRAAARAASGIGCLIPARHQQAHLFRLPGAALEFPGDGTGEQDEQAIRHFCEFVEILRDQE